MKSKIFKIVIILVIVAVLVAVYILFLQPDESSQGSLSSSVNEGNPVAQNDSTEAQGDAVNQELVATLTSLQEINLSGAIFENEAFMALEDISRPLLREGNEGRRNPFAPIGSDVVIVDVNSTSNAEEGGINDAGENESGADTDEELDIFGLPTQ
jgi:hypothetical protein